MGKTNHLEAAKGIMSADAEDIGDAEVAQATAHALIVAAENLAELVRLLRTGDALIETRNGGLAGG